jgi:hypothetical protein
MLGSAYPSANWNVVCLGWKCKQAGGGHPSRSQRGLCISDLDRRAASTNPGRSWRARGSASSPQWFETVGPDLIFVLLGIAATASRATLLVESVRRISHIESTQTKLGLTVVGFTTGFELVVRAWSASQAVVAGVVGSFAYNVTMTLEAAAMARPVILQDVHQLHIPLLAMPASLAW